MDNFRIDKITPADITQLQQIACDTFSETFATTNTAEDMQQYLTDSLSISTITNEMNNPHSHFYFSVLDNKIIGYLKINTHGAQTEIKDDNALEIERIYILKAYHGKNIGQLLYNHAIELAHQMNANYVWLGVWEKNARAIAFYTKNGFVPFDKHIFKLGNDEQTDIMMKKTL